MNVNSSKRANISLGMGIDKINIWCKFQVSTVIRF